MALSDYGFVNNDIIINTPIEKIITGFLLAINKVYYAIAGSDNGNISTFLASISLRHFIINNSSYDYLRLAEQVMFYEGYSNINNVFKRYCYLNETSGVFILYNASTTADKLYNRNIVMQDAVDELIDDGFQTSILPFYYYNNDYLTAVEFESFYRVFAYPFFKDYFIQRLKYLSLLRIYAEYRNYRWNDNLLVEGFFDSDYLTYSHVSFADAIANIQYKYYVGFDSGYFLRLSKDQFGTAPDLSPIYYYVLAIVKNLYVKKSFIDNFILATSDNLIYKIESFYEYLYNSQQSQYLINNRLIKFDMTTYYSLTYEIDGVQTTDDFYKIQFPFDYNDMLNDCIDKVDQLPFAYGLSTCYWRWQLETYITTISNGFDFSDI